MSYGLPRWILAVYYIFQALFAVGYGDAIVPDPVQLELLIIVMIFGTKTKSCDEQARGNFYRFEFQATCR